MHNELINDPEFELAQSGKIAILSGLTRAMTAFAVLQNVTHKRTMEYIKTTVMWKGLVVEEEKNEQSLIQYHQHSEDGDEHAPDVIHELEEILGADGRQSTKGEEYQDLNGSALSLATQSFQDPAFRYPMYEITTSTRRTTIRTTRIRPIDPTKDEHHQPKAKYIIVRSDEDDAESFMAIIDEQQDSEKTLPGAWIKHTMDQQDEDPDSQKYSSQDRRSFAPFKTPTKGIKIMLSAVSKKLSRKKVERQVKYERDVIGRSAHHGSMETLDLSSGEEDDDENAEPITMVTSTSTTLRSTSAEIGREAKPLPPGPPPQPSASSSSLTTTPTSSIPAARVSSTPPSPPSPQAATKAFPERAVKRKSSWSRLKLKGARKKSVSNIFQKGIESSRKKSSASPPTPPVPSIYLQHPASPSSSSSNFRNRSNSITSVSSISRTLTTTTYTQRPQASPSNTAPSSRPTKIERHSKSLVRSPSLPNTRKKRKARSPLEREPNPRNFPRRHIINNIAHFMRYASAAYGESFMRILGIGDIPSVLPNSHHPNHHAFAHHTGVSVDDILLSSYTDRSPLTSVQHPQLHALVHYVTVDHTAQAVVLTCRGTLGLSDVLTDLTCDYAQVEIAGRKYTAHAGMLEAAQLLSRQKGRVYQAIVQGLEEHPSYGLVLCGHSLGAGVASLLSLLWSEERDSIAQVNDPVLMAALTRDPVPFVTSRDSGLPPGRPIHCYTYGPPCVMCLELSEYCGRGLVTSIVHGYDIVPCLSLGLLKDFKNVAVSLYNDSDVADDILKRIVGRYHRKNDKQAEKEQDDTDADDQWFWALIKTMRADMRADKLYPPSIVYLIESTPQLVQRTDTVLQGQSSATSKSQHKRAHMVKLSRCDDVAARFSEIVFARSMFMDHSPNMYENAIRHLCRGFFGQYGAYENI